MKVVSEKIKDNSFKNVVELKKYISDKAKNHKNFKYYSKSERISNILKNHSIYLSNGKNWNDKIDKEQFNNKNNKYVNFGLCLSFSKTENVAMWMLYSGNDGCMIDYSPKTINAILEAQQIKLGCFDKKSNNFECMQELKKGDYEISSFDIIYYSDAKDVHKYYVKRSEETNKEFPRDLINQLSYQKKGLAWSYENECRIVVSVKREIISDPKIDTVSIEFPEEFVSGLKCRTYDSPNAVVKKYEDSSLKTKINWDLCRECKNSNAG